MQLRRSFALTAAAVTLATTGLASCGFDYATDRVYTPGVGVNHRDGEVDVLSAVIVSGAEGAGTFVATLVNNDLDNDAAMTEVSGSEGSPAGTSTFEAVTIPRGGLVNLAEPPVNIALSGEFAAGDFVGIAVKFDSGETATLDVPVVDATGYYEGLDSSGDAPVESPESE